ncbi:MAG: hypothetical protein ACRC1H_15075 [Caldilineaceae bacterium]
MTHEASPSNNADEGRGLSEGLGPTLRRLRMYVPAYASAVLMLPGWIAGLVWHRMCDGWDVARRQLDRLDDAVIEDTAKHGRGPGA